MTPTDPRHGTRRGYYAHRKVGQAACDPCKRAAAAAEAARQLRLLRGQAGRIDATGTRRRLQALVCLGYNWKLLGQHVGASENMIKRWAERDAPGAYVFRDTADKVGAVYERLSMKLPPLGTTADRIAAAKARNRARRAGWAPPLAWDDVDDPDEKPTGWRYEDADRREVLRDLADMGLGITEASRRLRLKPEAVEKYCARHRMRDVYRRLAAREALSINQHSREGAA